MPPVVDMSTARFCPVKGETVLVRPQEVGGSVVTPVWDAEDPNAGAVEVNSGAFFAAVKRFDRDDWNAHAEHDAMLVTHDE